MYDLFARDTKIVLLIAVAAVLIILPTQLALCFKAKRLFIKLIPTVLLAVATFVLYIMAITAKDWSGFVYIILAVAAGVLLIFSGIAWGIWAITKLIKRTK